MKPMIKFRIRWTARGKEQIYELSAASAADARYAFNAYRLPGVQIASIEPIEPDASAPPISNGSPDLPFSPLVARRKLGENENVR